MRIRARPTFFLVLVAVLLVLALAAPRLERLDDEDAELARARLIGSAQIRNGSLLLRDFKRGQLESRFATNRTVQKVNKLQTGLAHKVSALEHKVIGLDGKVVALDGKVEGLEHKFGELSLKWDGLTDKFAPLQDLDALEDKVSTLAGKLDALAKDAESFLKVETAEGMFVGGSGSVTTTFDDVASGESATVAKLPGFVEVLVGSDQENGHSLSLRSLGPTLRYTVQTAGGQQTETVESEQASSVSLTGVLVALQVFSASDAPDVATVTLSLVPQGNSLQVVGQTLAGPAR